MTIIAKAVTEKKVSDKMEQPFFVEENSVPEHPKVDPEAQYPKAESGNYYYSCHRILRRIDDATTVLLYLALMILIIGVIGALYTYSLCARTQMHGFRTGWYIIPYDGTIKSCSQNKEALQGSPDMMDLNENYLNYSEIMDLNVNYLRSAFKERFEIDLEYQYYEKIEVPNFRDGRQARFIHDFNINKTGIIDIDGKCCFVMPLNRQRVLPPRSMYDLLKKLQSGYYEVDTEIVRETMKVITPPIADFSSVGTYIAGECRNLPTYMLKMVNLTVVKRSASAGIFGEFAGKSIMELNILNLEDVQDYQKSLQD